MDILVMYSGGGDWTRPIVGLKMVLGGSCGGVDNDL
jgi:hypothetical protein